MSKPYTKEEVTVHLMKTLAAISNYWANIPNHTPQERVDGAIHSVLVMIDGESTLPKFSLEADPHPDDKEFHVELGEDYYRPIGARHQDISGDLHERWTRICTPHGKPA